MAEFYNPNAIELLEKAILPLYEKLKNKDFVNGTVELINTHLEFNPEHGAYIDLGESRKAPIKYVENELAWYLSMDRSIKGHPGIEDNKIWSKVCSDDGAVNSNYGWCCFSPLNGIGGKSQYDFALEQLKNSPNGRQSVIFYSRPSMQWEWNDNVHAKYDFTCTTNTQHFIRNNKLEYIVNMRSNDFLRGLQCADFSWAHYVYEKFVTDLRKAGQDVEYGSIFWNAGSLHAYERDYVLLEAIAEEYLEFKNKLLI